MMDDRIKALIGKFNGAIKYTPMLKDHPDWSDDECVAFAQLWHERAITQLRDAFHRDRAGNIDGHWHNPAAGIRAWNDRIPYCRNQPTTGMIDEATKL